MSINVRANSSWIANEISAAKTVDRVIDVFPADQQNKIRATLSEAMKGVVAQHPDAKEARDDLIVSLQTFKATIAHHFTDDELKVPS